MRISKNNQYLVGVCFLLNCFWTNLLTAQSLPFDSLALLEINTISQKIHLKDRIQKILATIEAHERLAYSQTYYNRAADIQDSFFLAHSASELALIKAITTDTFKYHLSDNHLTSSSSYEEIYLQENLNFLYNFIGNKEVQSCYEQYRVLQSQYGIQLQDLPKNSTRDLYPALQILKDQSDTLNFETILTHPNWFSINNTTTHADWYKLNNTIANFDPKATYWVKLLLHGSEQTDTGTFFIENLEGFTSWHNIQAYLVHENGAIEQQQTGINLPRAKKPFPIYNNLVSFSVTANEKATLYLRLNGTSGKRKPIFISLLGTRHKHFYNNQPYVTDGTFNYSSPLTPYKGNKIDIRNIFIDTSQQQGIEYIAKKWDQLPHHDGYDLTLTSQNSYWTKIQLVGNEQFNGKQLFHLSPYPFVGTDAMSFDYIDYYYADEFGEFQHQQTGNKISLWKRPFYLWSNFLQVEVPTKDTLDLFIRLEGVNPRFRPHRLDLWHIDASSVFPKQMKEAMKNALYYGILGIQFFFFMLLFLIDKERIHFYFGIMILGIFLSQGFSEDNYRFFVPFPVYRDFHIPLFFTGLFFVQYGFLKFATTYFNYPKKSLVTQFLVPIFLTSSVFINIYAAFRYRYTEIGSIPLEQYYYITAIIFMFLGIFIAFLIGVFAPQKRNASKRFFIAAFFPGLLTILLFLLRVILGGLLGSDVATNLFPSFLFSYDATKISNILMLFLFALSTGYRTNLLKAEKQNALEKNVQAQQTIIEKLKQTDQLQALNRLKTRFFTNITHEFRTPLTVILGMTEQGTHPQTMVLIRRNGQKLLNLVNQLLDLSKLDAGQLQPTYKLTEIVSFTQYVGESFQSLADKKFIRLTVYSEINELWLDMDEEKYRQIISNLLSNAIKFTSESGKIILHLYQKEAHIHIKITDNGIGISSKELPFIFDRFYQVENATSQLGKGTGIGLALVKELVELLAGKIEVTSELGKGTTFNLQFPIRCTSTTKLSIVAPQKFSSTLVSSSTILLEPKRGEIPTLLIVEDNPDVVIYIQSLLAQQYNLEIATNGEIGIQKAIETIPDLILSDVMMPKKNGFELVTTLKQDERTSHIPIVLLTAKATQADRLTGLKHGADAYLMKPFDKEELLIRLEKLFAIRQKLQEKYSNLDPQIIIQKEKTLEEIFLEKLHTVLEKHYENSELDVNQISSFMQMSYNQFNRKLKALTNKTPAKYLRVFRLQKGKSLLVDPNIDLNVSEVAYEVGFTDPNYFSRSFGELFGQSPNSMRKYNG